jgi:hypothetical protein
MSHRADDVGSLTAITLNPQAVALGSAGLIDLAAAESAAVWARALAADAASFLSRRRRHD